MRCFLLENMIKNNKKEKSIVVFKKARRIIGKMIKMLENDECCEKVMYANVVAVTLVRRAHRLLMENEQVIQLNKYKK